MNVNLECLGWTVILSSNMEFSIAVLYNPHDVIFCKELKNLLSVVENSRECMLFGDINWKDKSGESKLKSIMKKYKYEQLIDRTESKTLIDLIFTNRPERIKTYYLIIGLSDHSMILIIRKLTKRLL